MIRTYVRIIARTDQDNDSVRCLHAPLGPHFRSFQVWHIISASSALNAWFHRSRLARRHLRPNCCRICLPSYRCLLILFADLCPNYQCTKRRAGAGGLRRWLVICNISSRYSSPALDGFFQHHCRFHQGALPRLHLLPGGTRSKRFVSVTHC